jgi:hypothetical protein
MSAETKILLEKQWKDQVVKYCRNFAVRIGITDKERLSDYVAGVHAGWDECLRAMKLHGMMKGGMPLPRIQETSEQTAKRVEATRTIESMPSYLPRDRWVESADESGTFQRKTVRNDWIGDGLE